MSRLAKSRGLSSDVSKYRHTDMGTAKPPRKKASRVPETRVEAAGVTDSSGNGKSPQSVVRNPRQPRTTGKVC